jgi:hypothetical protein
MVCDPPAGVRLHRDTCSPPLAGAAGLALTVLAQFKRAIIRPACHSPSPTLSDASLHDDRCSHSPRRQGASARAAAVARLADMDVERDDSSHVDDNCQIYVVEPTVPSEPPARFRRSEVCRRSMPSIITDHHHHCQHHRTWHGTTVTTKASAAPPPSHPMAVTVLHSTTTTTFHGSPPSPSITTARISAAIDSVCRPPVTTMIR